MSDLAAALVAAGLHAPDAQSDHLGLVLPGVAAALGAPGPAVDSVAQRRLGLPDSRTVVVVLIDGLGLAGLTDRAGHAPFLRGLLAANGAGLETCFPTTTASALTFFGTGKGPGRTGLVGYEVRDPRTGRLANLVQWRDVADPENWQREPTVFSQLADAGVPVTTVGPARFVGSGLTRAALAGGEYLVAESLADRVDVAARLARQEGLVYLHWDKVDKAGHHHGWRSWQWGDALEAADAQIGRLARLLPAGTTLVVTADHGMVDIDRTRRWDLADEPDLAQDVAALGGEARALHVYLDPDVAAADVARRWQAVLGEHAIIATKVEAIAAGLFGEVAEGVGALIGDLVVAMAGRAGVVDGRTQPAGSLALVGVHGSLTELEVQVPFLVAVK